MLQRLATALVAAALLAPLTAGAAGEGPPAVQCVETGEGTVTGRFASVGNGKLTLLRDGVEQTLALTDFREIVLGEEQASAVPPPWTVWGDGGALFMARLVTRGSAPEMASLEGYGWRAESVPLGAIRALASREFLRGAAAERREFDKLRESPPPSSDRVMVAAGDGPRVLSCVVESITDAGLAIVAGEARSAVAWADVRWAVLSPGAGPSAAATGHLVELTDGTRICVQSFELREGTLTGRDDGALFSVEAGRLARIRIGSDAYRYLSDLKPESVAVRPFLDVVWQPRFDRAASGGPLVLAGRTYGKGIGMDARTEMTFALDGAYSRFYATVGVDASGAAGARAAAIGKVVFKVLTDGRQVYESGPLTAADAPGQVSLDARGVRLVTLVADFGSDVAAAGNFADWAEARVVR